MLLLRVHSEDLARDIRILGDKFHFLIHQRLLIMDVSVTGQLKDLGSFLVVLKSDFQLIVNVAETFDAGIFSDSDLAPGLDDLRLAAPQLLVIVKLVIAPVL